MRQLWPDFRYALRGLRLSPLFAAVAVLSLALGIGANAAIFTLLDQLLLRQLPVADADELVMLRQEGNNMGSNLGSRMHSYPLYRDLQQRADVFSQVLARRVVAASLSVDNQSERVQAELVSGNYFSMLGVEPAVGRLFRSEEDDRVYRGHPVVVLSHGYWERRFARDPAIVGQTVRVNDYPMTVIGISAKDFVGLDPASSPDVRVPILMQPVMMREQSWLQMEDRRARWVQVFARLRPGVDLPTAQSAVQALFAQVRQHEMTLPAAREWSAYARAEFMKGRLIVEEAEGGYSPLRNSVSTALVVLMAMVGLVLVMACANVANLLIARGFARQKEIAVRLSLGATRARLVGQLVVESLVLAGLGGVLGLVLAYAMTSALLAFVPSQSGALLISARPDPRVLAFTVLLSGATSVLFGLLPALRTSRVDPWTTLKEAMTSIAGAKGSVLLRKALVTGQVALSFLLLFGAGLFVRSLLNLRTTDAGVALENLITFQVSPALAGHSDERGQVFYRDLLQKLRTIPDIEAAALASVPILAGSEWDNSMRVEGYTARDGEDMQAFMNALSPGYFRTMKIPILQGRDFSEADAQIGAPGHGAPWKVAIVNRRFASHFFPRGDPIGKRLGSGGANTPLTIEIVGVVEDSLYEGPREGVRRQVFVPQAGANSAAIYFRTRSASAPSYEMVRRLVDDLDPAISVYQLKTLESQLDETLLTDRIVAMLSAAFGVLATLLASVGLYGVMAFVVARRQKELGIRIALGAPRGRVLWLILREVLMLLGLGLVVGVPVGLALGRYVGSQLYGVQPYDPAVAGTIIALLAVVSLAAGLVPAHRASRIDPMLALRHE